MDDENPKNLSDITSSDGLFNNVQKVILLRERSIVFIYRQVLEIEAEISPEYPKAVVKEVIEKELSKKGEVNIYVVVEEQDLYTQMMSVYALEFDSMDRELFYQAETSVLCFRTRTLYNKGDSKEPTESELSLIADIYTHDQLRTMGVSFKEGIPEYMETPYARV